MVIMMNAVRVMFYLLCKIATLRGGSYNGRTVVSSVVNDVVINEIFIGRNGRGCDNGISEKVKAYPRS